ncbi:hypothetical protein, partial [Promicromonospora citrea]|uniref:hypothetical protein n=1 Tax=Promicromonospora citrea TaxID=43677 RepID=UPI001BB217BD
MKLNATAEMEAISWPGFADIHPYAPADQTQGYAELVSALEAQPATQASSSRSPSTWRAHRAGAAAYNLIRTSDDDGWHAAPYRTSDPDIRGTPLPICGCMCATCSPKRR